MKTPNVLFISGIQNSRMTVVTAINHEKIQCAMTGSANIYFNLNSKKIKKSYLRLDLRKNQKINLDNVDILFNQISDPDTHSKVLIKLFNLINNKKDLIIVNNPLNILETTRDKIFNKLKNIPKLIVPKTVKFNPKTPYDIDNEIKNNDFTFPVILRKAGTHGGESVVFIKNFEETKTLYSIALDGKDFYLIQFHDYKVDEIYVKYRLVVVKGEVFLRHVIFSNEWMIHSRSREFMTENSQYESKEIELLQNFEKELKEKIQPTITKIYQKVKLDYFGIDCNIDNVFNLIIFEVNANMNILTNSSNNLISKKPILIIKNAVEKMLLEKGN